MAGKRRQKGLPTRRVRRVEARMDRLNKELGGTADPRERVQIAFDHYRAALKAQFDEDSAQEVAEYLVDAGNKLLKKSLGGSRVEHAR